VQTDTIVALATPPGVSAIAVVRVSGPAVPAICKAILPKFKMQPKQATLVKANSPTSAFIDMLIAIYFRAPSSYTGEDVLELFPHGNPFIIRLLIKEICSLPNVRLANRGEFTQRAFLNGKMDLTQAEAIGDILSANNSKNLINAQKLLNGEISGEIKELAENIKDISAKLELEIDFVDDIDSNNPLRLPLDAINKILAHLQSLKKRFRKSANELPKVVLFGAPNAGKSSLINALVKENRLLVAETPGTTRDFVEVPLHLPSGDILLIDTAGLATEAQNEIDKQAMQKTEEILQKANMKILVADISIPLPKKFEEWIKSADLAVGTHADLINNNSQLSIFNSPTARYVNCFATAIPLNTGINQLITALDSIFFQKTEESEESWITSERQIACIKKAEECILNTFDILKQANAVELAAFEMREARNALCSIIGEISNENILDTIFSSYCIGK
jgi:tRNA modification GTPase